jgi:uncharacterized cupredoxin-like copper-binding protein
MKALPTILLALTLSASGSIVFAKGDLATRKEYKLETGKYYRWKVEAGDKREYNLVAPEFWRNAWIRQIAVGDIEIKTGTLEELDFDGPGSVEVFFVPIRPGTYEFRIRGLEQRGMVGKLIVE